VKAALTEAFHVYGLPLQINVDNGSPWGSGGSGGISKLALWLMRLGIGITYSTPAHPQTNGKDERFHRTLKAEVLQARTFRRIKAVQTAFDEWRPVYNFERPHDALEGNTPSSRYVPSPRTLPARLPPIEYAPGDQIRKVQNGGTIWFGGTTHYVSESLIREPVAVRPTRSESLWEVYYVRQKLATIDLRTKNKKPRKRRTNV
jgi:hypothetical protein